MTRITSASVMFVVFLMAVPAGAENENDYFTANQSQGTQVYLSTMEANHGDKILPLIGRGRNDEAVTELKYCLDRFPNHPKYLMLVRTVERLTKKPLAIHYFERATRLFPQYALTHAQYGWYLIESGRTESGIGKLQQSIDMDPKLTTAYVWLARAYARIGNQELAQKAASQAAELGYSGAIPRESQETTTTGR